MNTAVMNVQCLFESFFAWLRQPARAKAVTATKPSTKEKPRVRIAGLR